MLGILTCKDIPQLTPGDQLFCKLLEKENIAYRPIIWGEEHPMALDIEALVIRSPWDYHYRAEAFLNYLDTCEEVGIQVINNARLVYWNHKKTYLKDFKEKNIPIVDSLFFSSPDDFDDVVSELQKKNWQDIVVKPAISATSYLTFKTTAQDPDLKNKCTQILERSEGLVQPFISNIASIGEVSLIFFKGAETLFSHAVIKKPKSQDFRVQSEFGGSAEAFTANQDLINLGHQIMATVREPWLYARVDLVDWQKNPQLSELEMIEPDLFFATADKSPETFVSALKFHLSL